MAVLIFSIAVLLRGAFRWPIVELMVSVLWSPIISFIAVELLARMTWSEVIAGLNQKALFTMIIYICSPIIRGTFAGSVLLKARERLSHHTP